MGGQELIMKASGVLDIPELLMTAEVAALLKVNRVDREPVAIGRNRP
jgi:hypothetical protein